MPSSHRFLNLVYFTTLYRCCFQLVAPNCAVTSKLNASPLSVVNASSSEASSDEKSKFLSVSSLDAFCF